ncbi:nitroreductase family protein [Desulfovibrio aerotolerans]|uniref:Nitroreductase family protein n=1 Tax=Solidesulfovibrio aerotolerans TaxID=295255 RepID=A0A7C9IR10_9BACT|nr:nitroreductase family protein [Solidesulfovibrio aerotolerans]MYL81587.1 nitroreductase family protein [Solidesulfovibrio aerotolerans]
MELFEALHTRRSIRAFTDQPISEADLETILRAAMDAPSAVNAQPWHFVVITDRAMLDPIPDIHPHAAMCRTAQAAIVSVAEIALEKAPGNWMVDCSAAVENLLLAARGLGIGSVWCGLYPRQERMAPMAALLGLPEGFLPHALVPLGYPAQEFKRVERFKPERIHRNGW